MLMAEFASMGLLGSAMIVTTGGSGWHKGLEPQQQYEWLVDCYRVRVDDDYAYGGGCLHGLYAASAYGGDSTIIMIDFLIFCKLAVKNGALTKKMPWDWAAFLKVASEVRRG